MRTMWLFTAVLACGCDAAGAAMPGARAPHEAAEAQEASAAARHGADADDDEPLPTDAATVARAAGVRVLQEEDVGCPAEALGPVDVHKKMETTQKALDALKLRAAALGAEAVVHTEFEHGEGGDAPTHLSGMAVRCHDLIHGRRYDVVGEVRLEGAMGKEEDAFRRFREKANALRADLVIDVKFEHGEGDAETTRITGKAIRFRAD